MGIKGFFKGLAKVGSFALPFVPIPGLAGNVALSTAVRGALGAGLGAATGGKKGALMGGLTGAAAGAGGNKLLGKALGMGGGSGGAIKAPGSLPGPFDAPSSPGGILGALGKMKSAGLDPTTLALGGMSMFGGEDGPKSFEGSGRTDPKFALNEAMGMNDELIKMVKQRMKGRPEPVILPELPAQIGGGLGADPGRRMSLPEPVKRRKPEGGSF